MRALLVLLLVACTATRPVVKAAAKPVAAAAPAQVESRTPGCVENTGHRAQETHAAVIHYVIGLKALRMPDEKMRAEAVRYFEKVLQEAPWFAPAYRSLGSALALRGAWVPAYVAYTRYLSYDVYPADRERVSSERRILEQKQQAIAAYAEGEALLQKRDFKNASLAFERAVALKSTFSIAHRELGFSYLGLGFKPQARDAFLAYLQVDENAPDKALIQQKLAAL